MTKNEAKRQNSIDKRSAEKELTPRELYADIIDLPHWQSPTRPHMSLYDRSAQFSSYKALSGYEDMVEDEARRLDASYDRKGIESVGCEHRI